MEVQISLFKWETGFIYADVGSIGKFTATDQMCRKRDGDLVKGVCCAKQVYADSSGKNRLDTESEAIHSGWEE